MLPIVPIHVVFAAEDPLESIREARDLLESVPGAHMCAYL